MKKTMKVLSHTTKLGQYETSAKGIEVKHIFDALGASFFAKEEDDRIILYKKDKKVPEGIFYIGPVYHSRFREPDLFGSPLTIKEEKQVIRHNMLRNDFSTISRNWTNSDSFFDGLFSYFYNLRNKPNA